jgi:diguanylate cyclase
VVATDSSAIDACEHLEDPDMAVSASCIPLRLGDRVLGVVSIVQAPGEGPDEHTLEMLEWLVERTGTRISELRRLAGRRSAFREDAVTGLPGPDALDSHLRESFRSLVPFCVALVDIDDFEGIEHLWPDEHIDDALRTIAGSLRLTLRPDDVVCRIDHGRFAVLLGNCGAVHASLALERVRESLALSLSVAGSTPFTFSAGVVESHRATSIEDLLEQARSATRLAHGNGGNRVALAHD